MINDKRLKEKEQIAINQKSIFIQIHSAHLLEKLNSDDGYTFSKEFVAYLLSNNLDPFGDNEWIKCEPSYDLSMEVIFKLCYSLPHIETRPEIIENIKNKLREYTKSFSTVNRGQNGLNKFIKLDEKQLVKIRQK